MSDVVPGDKAKHVVLMVTAPVTFGIFRGFPGILTAEGWKVTLLSSPGTELDQFETDGLDVERVAMKREPAPVDDLRSLVDLVRILRRIRPDIVVAGTPKAGLLGTVAALIARVPVRVYDVKGLRYETETGFRRTVFTILESVACAASTRVLAISPSIREALSTDRIVRARKIDLVGSGGDNGVDPGAFDPGAYMDARIELRAEWNVGPDTPVFGFVGRIHRDKGVDELLAAATSFAEHGDDGLFVFVGGDDDLSYKPLDDVGINVRRVGFVDDPRPYFAAFDVFCLPTYREGLPNVNLQASAMELPVVTTDATGAVDSVVNGVTGYLVRPRDAIGLADRLRELGGDSGRRREMGGEGRQWVATNFSTEEVWARRSSYFAALVDGYDQRTAATRETAG